MKLSSNPYFMHLFRIYAVVASEHWEKFIGFFSPYAPPLTVKIYINAKQIDFYEAFGKIGKYVSGS